MRFKRLIRHFNIAIQILYLQFIWLRWITQVLKFIYFAAPYHRVARIQLLHGILQKCALQQAIIVAVRMLMLMH